MWRLCRRRGPSTDKSKQALESAETALRDITSRHEEVTQVAASLRKIRKDNHFSEHLTRIMMGEHR